MATRLLFVLVAAASSAACSPTRFVRSDSAFQESPRAQPPEVFLEGAPQRPWRSVGMIEVTLQGEVTDQQVVRVAVEAAQKAGCELLTPAKKKQSLAAVPRLRLAAFIAHDHGEHGGQPPERPQAPAREGSDAEGKSSDVSGSADRGGGGPESTGGAGRKTRRWRFDCGVYAAEAPKAAHLSARRYPSQSVMPCSSRSTSGAAASPPTAESHPIT